MLQVVRIAEQKRQADTQHDQRQGGAAEPGVIWHVVVEIPSQKQDTQIAKVKTDTEGRQVLRAAQIKDLSIAGQQRGDQQGDQHKASAQHRRQGLIQLEKEWCQGVDPHQLVGVPQMPGWPQFNRNGKELFCQLPQGQCVPMP